MKFVHLVEINDPLNPLVEPLTRTQLWRGLVLRAASPGLFVPWLDKSDILARTDDGMERVLIYGEVRIRDHVSLFAEHELRYDVPQQTDIPASRLLVTIEEPAAGLLNVRFCYDDFTPDAEGSMDAFYNEFRHSAYQESDIDTVRIIRQLAGEGRFDQPLL